MKPVVIFSVEASRNFFLFPMIWNWYLVWFLVWFYFLSFAGPSVGPSILKLMSFSFIKSLRIFYFMVSSYPFCFLSHFWLLFGQLQKKISLFLISMSFAMELCGPLLLWFWDKTCRLLWANGKLVITIQVKDWKPLKWLSLLAFTHFHHHEKNIPSLAHWFQEEDEKHVEQSQLSARISNHSGCMSNMCLLLYVYY